jgi:SAM-dependent methyltransferase
MPSRNVLFQSEQHPLVAERFQTLSDYCLSLVHRKAYETGAELTRGKRVLDLGCNNGYGSEIISRTAARVTGVDVSPKSIDAARARCPNLEFHLVDGSSLPFPDASFDAIVSFQVVEHVDDTDRYLAEIRRVLVPGGVAIFTTPNREIRLSPGMKPWNEFHVREYSGTELAQALGRAFTSVEIRSLRGSPEFEKIELRRVRIARLAAIGKRSSSLVARALGPVRSARKRLRTALQLAPLARLRERSYRRFSTGDLHYEPGPSASALDLMAVCTR